MKYVLIILMFISLNSYSQKWYSITNNDIAVMSTLFGAGYATGWREEVIYHPNQLFKQYPNLNRAFWDIRVQNPPGFMNTEWDADHILKATTATLFVTAVVIRKGEKKKWYLYIVDGVKYYLSYKAGFFASYNLTLKNKL